MRYFGKYQVTAVFVYSSPTSSAVTSAASATPIRWKMSRACRRFSAASLVGPRARAQRPRSASALASSRGLAISRDMFSACL